MSNLLSKNIKYLRKREKISQEDLAKALGIKRSNIAAYESKNVEPRLRIILELAKFFNVSIQSLVRIEFNEGTKINPFNEHVLDDLEQKPLNINDGVDVDEFIKKSINIKKVLEGFKAFYAFKKNHIGEKSEERDKLTHDIDGFIQLMEHLLAYNETVIKAISNINTVSKT